MAHLPRRDTRESGDEVGTGHGGHRDSDYMGNGGCGVEALHVDGPRGPRARELDAALQDAWRRPGTTGASQRQQPALSTRSAIGDDRSQSNLETQPGY